MVLTSYLKSTCQRKKRSDVVGFGGEQQMKVVKQRKRYVSIQGQAVVAIYTVNFYWGYEFSPVIISLFFFWMQDQEITTASQPSSAPSSVKNSPEKHKERKKRPDDDASTDEDAETTKDKSRKAPRRSPYRRNEKYKKSLKLTSEQIVRDLYFYLCRFKLGKLTKVY